jgi:hypothetical protein
MAMIGPSMFQTTPAAWADGVIEVADESAVAPVVTTAPVPSAAAAPKMLRIVFGSHGSS